MDAALRERATRLASFHHDHFTRVRVVEAESSTGTLLVVSDHISGVRLSALLAAAEKRSLSLDILAVRCLVRQLAKAVAAWYEAMPDLAHGAIGPERIIVTPNGRIVIADCVLGSALPSLRYTRERYWSELRVAVPPTPATPVFDSRSDVMQMGLVVLAMVLGRRVNGDIYPGGLTRAIDNAALRPGATAPSPEPLPLTFRTWLRQALQIDARTAFPNAGEAAWDLDDAIGTEDAGVERDALHVFLARCLALDMRLDTDAKDADSGSLTLEAIDDVASEVDLAPRIEALRAFLARYPMQQKRPTAPVPPPPSAVAPPAPPASAATPEQKAAPEQKPASEQKTAPVPFMEPVAVEQSLAAPASSPAAPVTEPATTQPLESETPPIESSESLPVFDRDAKSSRRTVPISDAWMQRLRIGGIVAGVAAVALLAWYGIGLLSSNRTPASGSFSITTTPPGILVTIDNVKRGVTPLSIELPPGDHMVELSAAGGPRKIPVTIKAGSQTSQFMELSTPAPTPATATLGELQVRTDPAAATVTVDGRFVGRSPVSVADLAPGSHNVVLTHTSGSVSQRVVIEAGRTTSLVVPLGDRPGASAAGWISIASTPTDVQVFEEGRLLGTSRIDRIMLPVGRHDLDIVNESLGFRQRRSVQVTAGQVSPIRVEWPNGTLALNAVPWAEVFIDGMSVGETPIGSIQVPIGQHEILFRHPELGERRQTVTVTASATAKVGVVLSTK